MSAATSKLLAIAFFAGAACLALPLILLYGDVSSAQTKRTIRIIVPSTVGGGADLLARLLADHMGRAQNIKVVVENRPGASNTIGTEVASRAEPDGNTLLISTPEFVINTHLRKLNYDPLTSFRPVCYLARSPQVFVVHALSPYRTLKDLLDAARARPGEITFASAGPASSTRFAIEMLKRLANVTINYIPYQGSTPAVNAVLSGQVNSALASYPNVVGLVKDNQLHALAVTSPVRVSEIPDVPTVAESGFEGYEFGYLVWRRCTGRNAGESHRRTRRLVHGCCQRAGTETEICGVGLVRNRNLRKQIRFIHFRRIRKIRPHYPRNGTQDEIAVAAVSRFGWSPRRSSGGSPGRPAPPARP